MGDAGNLFVLAVDEISAAAGFAGEIVAAVPSHTHALSGLPVGNVSADGVDAAGNFVSGNPRVLDPRPIALFHHRVAMADAASFNFNSDLIPAGLGNVPLHELKIPSGLADLDDFHLRHSSFLMNSEK